MFSLEDIFWAFRVNSRSSFVDKVERDSCSVQIFLLEHWEGLCVIRLSWPCAYLFQIMFKLHVLVLLVQLVSFSPSQNKLADIWSSDFSGEIVSLAIFVFGSLKSLGMIFKRAVPNQFQYNRCKCILCGSWYTRYACYRYFIYLLFASLREWDLWLLTFGAGGQQLSVWQAVCLWGYCRLISCINS